MKALTIIAVLALISGLTGCANSGPSRESLMSTLEEIARQKAIAAFGPEQCWTPEQRAAFRAAVMESQLQAQRELDSERQQRAAVAAARIGQGLQQAGEQIASSQTDPLILYKMNAQRSTFSSGYRSWQNSNGSSGSYVPYLGGNGGTIFNSDGSSTTIDPQIGR
jgi:hypothetical protein